MPLGSTAEDMQGAREQLLSRPAFTTQQHGRVALSGPSQGGHNLFQGGILPNDFGETTARRQLLLEDDVLGEDLVAL